MILNWHNKIKGNVFLPLYSPDLKKVLKRCLCSWSFCNEVTIYNRISSVILHLYLIARITGYFVTVPWSKTPGALSWRCVRTLHWPMVSFRYALLSVVMATRESTLTLPFPCASPFSTLRHWVEWPLATFLQPPMPLLWPGILSREDFKQLMGRDGPTIE